MIYNDTATNERDVIVFDSRYLSNEPIHGVTIKQNNNFLTICEVEVFGKWKMYSLKPPFHWICFPSSVRMSNNDLYYCSLLYD